MLLDEQARTLTTEKLTPHAALTAGASELKEYPVIDVDPHFRRVVQNFRQSDYMVWAAGTGIFPSALYFMESVDPTRPPRGGLRSALKLSIFLGACGGFLMAYQRSSFRLWGWSENKIEAKRAEMQGDDAPGLKTTGNQLDEYMQGVAHRNSAYSQTKLGEYSMNSVGTGRGTHC